MRKLFFLFVAFLATTSLWAHDFKVDGIYYKILTQSEVAVTYCGLSFTSCDNEYSGSITIPSTVTYNGTTYSVTSIGDDAFYDCSSLTSVTIPNSVTSIGEDAFKNCSGLTSVTIGNSVTTIGNWAFEDCSGLTSVTIPNSVTSIGRSAFFSCSRLTSVTIGNSVRSIGDYAFKSCSRLTSVTIPNSVTSIGKDAFNECSRLTSVTIGNSVRSIGDYAFKGCSRLTSVVWNVKNYADFSSYSSSPFYNLSSKITSFIFGDGVQHIPAYLCYKMSKLTSITIPNSVTNIGDYAFYQCEKLGTLVLGDKVKNIGYEAFNGCNKLYHIYCYAPEPPMAYEISFANYNVNLYVPCNYLDNYKYDRVFGSFRYIQCIESEDVTTDDVVVTPGTNDVTITWPTESNAETYTIVIKKDGEVVCTLTFNADGQLLNIAFAPSRDGNNRPAQYAEQAGNGYRFTVTGLEAGTDYTYDITVKDTSNQTINSHTGAFTTQSTTAVENTHSQSPMTNCQKIFRNGQLIILRDGVEYNAMGQEL